MAEIGRSMYHKALLAILGEAGLDVYGPTIGKIVATRGKRISNCDITPSLT
jgi:hypothetical protein